MPCKGHPTQTSIRGASRVSKSIGRPGFGLAKLLKQKKKKKATAAHARIGT